MEVRSASREPCGVGGMETSMSLQIAGIPSGLDVILGRAPKNKGSMHICQPQVNQRKLTRMG